MPFRGRMNWVLSGSAAFRDRTGNLQVQHNAIIGELTYLRNVEALQPLRKASEISFENLGMIPMGRRRRSSKLSNGDRPGMKFSHSHL